VDGLPMEQCEAKSALEFVNEVKCRFIQDNTRDKYYHFLKVLKDCMTLYFFLILTRWCKGWHIAYTKCCSILLSSRGGAARS